MSLEKRLCRIRNSLHNALVRIETTGSIDTNDFGHEQQFMRTTRFLPSLPFCLLTVIVVFGVVDCRIGIAKEPRNVRLHNMLVINEDNSHFFSSRKPEDMTLKGLHAWVDQYAGSSVTHLFLCSTAMRASFRSKSRDAIWDPVNGKEPQDRWPQNAKRLHEAGLDPYKIWIARCRDRKISPWLSMRMNDVHNTEDRDNFQHSTFWRTHIKFWREPNHEHGSGLNYAYPEVRRYQMAFVRELLERYDPDGLELDWMRFPNHLTPGKEREERQILPRFVRDVRRLTRDGPGNANTRSCWASARRPSRCGGGLGMDAMEWARKGVGGPFVPCPFYFSLISTSLSNSGPGSEERPKTRSPWPPAWKAASVPGSRDARRKTLETLYGFAASGNHRGPTVSTCSTGWIPTTGRFPETTTNWF
ncbi:MAG: hypothetical protein Ct9H300mP1_05530 [Planctomycetaceae bacterium]|nr:MAG: hypothetical protein Ct9H300mP1_05530 [Planctomycetaceae bacterium]